jgi:hypothetical protein
MTNKSRSLGVHLLLSPSLLLGAGSLLLLAVAVPFHDYAWVRGICGGIGPMSGISLLPLASEVKLSRGEFSRLDKKFDAPVQQMLVKSGLSRSAGVSPLRGAGVFHDSASLRSRLCDSATRFLSLPGHAKWGHAKRDRCDS